PVVVSAEAERPRNKVRRLTVANRSTLRCANTSRHAAKRLDKNTPWIGRRCRHPLPTTERSTSRTSSRRNLPVASSTYARDTARPGRQGVRSKILATQKALHRRRPERDHGRQKLRLSTTSPLCTSLADIEADIAFHRSGPTTAVIC